MSKVRELPFTSLQFYATAPYPCSYLEHRVARSQVATPTHLIHADIYSELVSNGFRRSGLYTYRPYCDGCKSCIACRLVVNQFSPKRYQSRAWQKHKNLVSKICHLGFHEEHYDLYIKYQHARHYGGGMDHDNQDQYKQFLVQSNVNTRLIEFRDSNLGSEPGKLRIVCIVDLVNDGLSSVYTFYDTTVAQASYGTYAIYWQIQQVIALKLPYLYLGYLIKESPKMSYKANYQPLELLINGHWRQQSDVNE